MELYEIYFNNTYIYVYFMFVYVYNIDKDIYIIYKYVCCINIFFLLELNKFVVCKSNFVHLKFQSVLIHSHTI